MPHCVHDRTARLRDPGLPPLAALLGQERPGPLVSAVAAVGGELRTARPHQIAWWPGASLTVSYRAHVQGGALDGDVDLVATTGRIPAGTFQVGDGESRVGVWKVPHDPVLRGLPSALDGGRAGEVLDALGCPGDAVSPRLLAYRPTRRAVVAVPGRTHGLYLKLVPPAKARALHERHAHLARHLPVPRTLGIAADAGIVALQALPGRTLREALEAGDSLPPVEQVVGAVTGWPTPTGGRVALSPVDRLEALVPALAAIVPEESARLLRLREEIGADDVPAEVPVHGDYYESQVLVGDGQVVGLLDVDTAGWGRPGDDAATMLGHLSLWGTLSCRPDVVHRYGADLLAAWDRLLDPVDLRLRVAAVLLTLAPGSFRVQTTRWPEETSSRIDLAERWVDSARHPARHECERALTPRSAPSHGAAAG